MSTADTPPHPILRMSIAYHCVVLQCFYLRWHGKGEKNTWWARQFCLISKPKNSSFPPSVCSYFHLFHMLLYMTLHRTYSSLVCMEIWELSVDLRRSGTNRQKHTAGASGFSHDLNLQWSVYLEISREYFISPTSQLKILMNSLFSPFRLFLPTS